ncbi:dTDP-4-dehydrorhamnose reductase [Pantoea ananatis]|uniref:dTDP-4-dehydrorhamnose reductase n=1 Tax=Pantoea ananas TaxID=553 RepID=UPI000B7E8F9B|nr:dTDP-4-dehydrorhamnose reductase [Pantoea ananatis]AWQ18180.1 dTDP-4-dehydrorhamnose reductase [Pantoea ananatis]MBN6030064.1 dTDP-4-dehydrorhamnose reductase [Pantoea ananatis]MCK0554208.1 dTDP-4-dehydrorhamnose reductase [Pantoea ananatis]MCW0315855.1 dTDP-4-dehydrorhamnose reductase [Pantoea ananatis]MCW0333996.1 dTDP-4-dehydrorhamnose reductase [Pantoea ananatis]
MNILLFGKNGQVGWELQRALLPLGNIIALDRHSETFCGDFEDPEGIAETIRQIKPDVIVNATAYTAVDKAETDREIARKVNAVSVATLAQAAKDVDAWLIHYSTDYVFDGSGKEQWKESDETSPINYYGKTKLEGERAIINVLDKYIIFRTSWVYASRGKNFPKTMLKLAQEREKLSVIDDQFGAPTSAELIADCTAHSILRAVAQPELAGLYHLVASGETNWHEYASKVIECAKRRGVAIKTKEIEAVPTSAFPTAAYRPANSRLNTGKLCSAFNIHLPHWESGIIRLVDEICAQQTF